MMVVVPQPPSATGQTSRTPRPVHAATGMTLVRGQAIDHRRGAVRQRAALRSAASIAQVSHVSLRCHLNSLRTSE
jgi:hypothetical protein